MAKEILEPGVAWKGLADETDISADTYYYPSETGESQLGYDDLSLRYLLTGGVTMTVEAQQDATTDTSPTFIDVTKAGYNLETDTKGEASFIDLSGILDFDNFNVMKFRVKIVTSDGTNGIYLAIRQKSRDK